MHFNWAVHRNPSFNERQPCFNLLLKIDSIVILTQTRHVQCVCVCVCVCHQAQIQNTNNSRIHNAKGNIRVCFNAYKALSPWYCIILFDFDFVPWCEQRFICLVFVTRTNVRCMVKNADSNRQYTLALRTVSAGRRSIHQQLAESE